MHAVRIGVSSAGSVTSGSLHTCILLPFSCWIKPDPTSAAIWTFVGPMIIMVLVSNVLYCNVVESCLEKVMYKSKGVVQLSKEEMDTARPSVFNIVL